MNNLALHDQQTIYTAIAIVIFVFIKIVLSNIIKKYSKKFNYSVTRKVTINKLINFVLSIILIVTISLIWDLTFKGLSLFFVSFFTVAGIALFGNWSILSNVTASLVLYFNYPFKIGDHVKILDGDNSVSGEVVDINLFNIRLKNDDNRMIAYPNNLAMQKAIIKLEKEEN